MKCLSQLNNVILYANSTCNTLKFEYLKLLKCSTLKNDGHLWLLDESTQNLSAKMFVYACNNLLNNIFFLIFIRVPLSTCKQTGKNFFLGINKYFEF